MSTSEMEEFFDGVWMKSSGFESKSRNGLYSTSLVLDSQREELVKASLIVQRSAEKSTMAMKNHCEAERKRRARINAHLDTLRSLIPGANKMDKASLLAEVISHMKELERTAEKSSEGLLMPMDVDEVKVEGEDNGINGGNYLIRVSFCCDYKPGILSDLRRALDALHLIVIKAEIATLEGRMKNVFVITKCKEWRNGTSSESEVYQILASSIHQTIRTILDKFCASHQCSTKRRRLSPFNPSFSSHSGDVIR